MRVRALWAALLLPACARQAAPTIEPGAEALATPAQFVVRFPPVADSLGWPTPPAITGYEWRFGDRPGRHVVSFGIEGGAPNAAHAAGSLERVVRESTLRWCDPPPWHPAMACARILQGEAMLRRDAVVLVIRDTAFVRSLLRDRPATILRAVFVRGVPQARDSVAVTYPSRWGPSIEPMKPTGALWCAAAAPPVSAPAG